MKTIASLSIISIFCISAVSQASEQRVNLGNVTGGDSKKALAIIDKKCTTCHSKEKVDIALKAGKDMNVILKEMEKRGSRLTSNEREVLGIFWKQSKPISKK
jgi:uncharacterized membrane protein